MLFSSYENLHHTYLCLVPVLNSILRWRSQLTIFVWYTYIGGSFGHVCAGAVVVDSHVGTPYRTMALRHSKAPVQSHTLYKGACQQWVHRHPLRQPWWQEPQHLGCSLCMRYVGLSFTRAHYSYLCCIHIVLWVIIIFTYYCTMHILLCIYIMNAEFVCVTSLRMKQ